MRTRPTHLAVTRTRAGAGKTAVGGFVALLLSSLSSEALTSRLIKDKSTAPNQSALKRAAKFLASPRNKKQRQTHCNHIFAHGDNHVLNMQIQTSPETVADESADKAAYSTQNGAGD